MAKELRITFKESESDLYDYIKQKSSPSAFLKDLAAIEQRREDLYLNNQVITNNQATVQEIIASKEEDTEIINIDDLTTDDLGEF